VNGVNDIANGWFIGSPSAVFYDYEGRDLATSEAAEAAKFGQLPGDIHCATRTATGRSRPRTIASSSAHRGPAGAARSRTT
jgi:hypothetical protein